MKKRKEEQGANNSKTLTLKTDHFYLCMEHHLTIAEECQCPPSTSGLRFIEPIPWSVIEHVVNYHDTRSRRRAKVSGNLPEGPEALVHINQFFRR